MEEKKDAESTLESSLKTVQSLDVSLGCFSRVCLILMCLLCVMCDVLTHSEQERTTQGEYYKICIFPLPLLWGIPH